MFQGTLKSVLIALLTLCLLCTVFYAVNFLHVHTTYKRTYYLGKSTSTPKYTGIATKPTPPINLNDIFLSTDPKHTHVHFDEKRIYETGQRFRAKIIAHNFKSEPKRFGGDFFRAVLLREGGGIACSIEDHNNGTYSISATLFWEGKTELKVVLVSSSEAVHAIKLKTCEDGCDGIEYSSHINNPKTGKLQEVVQCGPFLESSKNMCNLSGPIYGEPWYCETPSSGCDAIKTFGGEFHSKKTTTWARKYMSFTDILKNWQVDIVGSGKAFNVFNSSKFTAPSLPPCGINDTLTTDNATGYFLNEQWKSTLCNNWQFSADRARQCLRNTDLYMFGDSTMRQLYDFLSDSLKLTHQRPSDSSFYQNMHISKPDGINIHRILHGAPFQNLYLLTKKKYVSVTMDQLQPKPGKRTIIFLTYGLHFLTFRASFFRDRVVILRKTILKLQARIPELQVFVKNINFHYEKRYEIPRTQWCCLRVNKILAEELKDVKNVIIINTWDMTLVKTPNDVHPPWSMLSHQTGLFLSHVCPLQRDG